ncbi:hypothetical protein L0U85_19040 [Glycomyces sp. L485]|uniref:hypothetical protein n=1 Tax=Glycomyces sp. L485 TaxID=2909235 RepID=UPI001F4AE7D8|nr:hypothetical protein [Glycomyces sp. L485]MCH7232931.1 hypothetical protein [Glycomyces sp. L485]
MTFPPQPPRPQGYPPAPQQPGHPPYPPRQHTMGPSGAYGPVGAPVARPVPGQPQHPQHPQHPQMTMTKPGTVTGIGVILWILMAFGLTGAVFSVIGLVDFFNPFSLIALGFALHTTVQSLMGAIHIARGKRWAWTWTLVSTILGLALAGVGLVLSLSYVQTAYATLIVGAALVVLYGTLLGLLVSKSARQWIIMHRAQRGQVQVPGMPGAPGMAGPGMAGPTPAAPQPERPVARPGAATFAVIVLGLLTALWAWRVFGVLEVVHNYTADSRSPYRLSELLQLTWFWQAYGIPLLFGPVVVVCGVITAILLVKGRAGGRIFGVIWLSTAILPIAYMVYDLTMGYRAAWAEFVAPGTLPVWLILDYVRFGLIVLALVTMFLPGVRRWTPRRPSSPMIMMVPMGPPAAQPPHGHAPQPQQQPFPPRY